MATHEPEKVTRQSSHTLFATSLILISAIILVSLMYLAGNKPRYLDKMPELLSLDPATMKSLSGNPGIVKVGLYIQDFSKFDIFANDFEFSGIIWFIFDPSIISLNTIAKFSFQKGEIVHISPPETRLVEGKLFASYNIRVRLKANLVYSLFPFQNHIFYIALDNDSASPAELIFDSTKQEFMISPDIVVSGWNIRDTYVYSGYSVSHLEKTAGENSVYHPRVVFEIDLTAVGYRLALTILLPLILIFFMAAFSMTMDPRRYYNTMLALSSGGITALIAYRFVIENLSPKVGYFMLSDYVFFLFLSAVFFIFLLNTGIIKLTMNQKKIIAVVFHIAIILCFVYLLRF